MIVHHTPSPALHAMFEAVVEGASDPRIEGVRVVRRAALGANSHDVLGADGYILGTPANIGYISGALKHFFDTVYYPCIDDTRGRPFGVWIHGNDDCTGAMEAIRKITTGLGWRQAAEPVVVTGTPSTDDLERCRELGRTIAALLSLETQ